MILNSREVNPTFILGDIYYQSWFVANKFKVVSHQNLCLNGQVFQENESCIKEYLLRGVFLSCIPYSNLSSPPKRPWLCQTQRGTRQRRFLFSPNLHKKLGRNFESIKFF